MIKTNIVLLDFTFKCRAVNETRAIVLVQACTQANNLATQLIAQATSQILPKITEANISFFPGLKRDVFFNFCVCHKKVVSGKHPIRENNTHVCFH